MDAFNSLSRDHLMVIAFCSVVNKLDLLSTPSLGITPLGITKIKKTKRFNPPTFNSLSRDHRRLYAFWGARVFFQLPLSGSQTSFPPEYATEILFSTFNSLSRDHGTRVSSSDSPRPIFQLPLSGSQSFEDLHAAISRTFQLPLSGSRVGPKSAMGSK